MKKLYAFICIIAAFASCLTLSGCRIALSLLEDIIESSTEYAEHVEYTEYIESSMRYSPEELVEAADALFDTSFTVVSANEPDDYTECASYVVHSDDIPFNFTLYSDCDASETTIDGHEGVLLTPHAYCDYYEKMMEYKAKEALEIAEQCGLDVTISGQEAHTAISGYDQLDAVYDYLYRTNELYNFSVVEAELTGLLRDIRTRPTLSVSLDSDVFGCDDEIVLLYYTINHTTYNYTQDALLPTIQEMYIEKLDSLCISDPAVTDNIRNAVVKPALTELRINGEPVGTKNCGSYTLDPNFIFDYDWKLQGYYADIRISAPAFDYSSAPSYYGDDRDFKYLVELLGGTYRSELGTQYNNILASYSSDWYLGGNLYTSMSFCQEYIPVESYFWLNDEYLEVKCTYSKEMWGLEDGYGPEDYYIRINLESFGSILGVDIKTNYEDGWLDLITPEGYYESGDSSYIFDTNDEAFGKCELVIPEGTTEIADSEYRECEQYTSVSIPDTVTVIGNNAFNWCKGLESLELPSSVKTIGDSAFSWCSGIESITLNNGVESIGKEAFSMCKSLREITIPENVKSIGSYTFSGCDRLQTVNILTEITELPNNMFLSCKKLENVILPKTLEVIGYRAFQGCSSLKTVELPEGLITIENMAFMKCTALEEIIIPGSVTTIGQSVFSKCGNVTIIAPHEPEYYGYTPSEGETWIVEE